MFVAGRQSFKQELQKRRKIVQAAVAKASELERLNPDGGVMKDAAVEFLEEQRKKLTPPTLRKLYDVLSREDGDKKRKRKADEKAAQEQLAITERE